MNQQKVLWDHLRRIDQSKGTNADLLGLSSDPM